MRHCLRVNDRHRRRRNSWYPGDDSDDDDDDERAINRNRLDDLELEWFRDAMDDIRSRPIFGQGASDYEERELVSDYAGGKAGAAAS